MRKPEEICPRCLLPYGFVRAKVTDLSTMQSHCLLCPDELEPKK